MAKVKSAAVEAVVLNADAMRRAAENLRLIVGEHGCTCASCLADKAELQAIMAYATLIVTLVTDRASLCTHMDGA